MKKHITTTGKLLYIILLCVGMLISCSDDDDKDNPASTAILSADPSDGFLVNSTGFRAVIDFGQQKQFQTTLEPGQMMNLNLQRDKTHVVHVVLLNESDRALSDFVNSFYIDETALDNQLRDFLCSWYVEFVTMSGYNNRFGS